MTGRHHGDEETVTLAQVAEEARQAHIPEADDTWALELHHITEELRGEEQQFAPVPSIMPAPSPGIPVPPEARAAWNQFTRAVKREQATYQHEIRNAAELHATSIADAREAYDAAIDAADRLYAATLDTALESCAEATDQARRARDRALDKHRHSLTPGVALEPSAVHPPKRRRKPVAAISEEADGDT